MFVFRTQQEQTVAGASEVSDLGFYWNIQKTVIKFWTYLFLCHQQCQITSMYFVNYVEETRSLQWFEAILY